MKRRTREDLNISRKLAILFKKVEITLSEEKINCLISHFRIIEIKEEKRFVCLELKN